MPSLHWIGKEKVVNHHQDVPFRVLQHQYGFDAEKGESKQSTESGNKIIHGDNLEALKSLLPEYEGKIKCIYIDPPYNTGEEKWKYNDNVNHPKIKKWIGRVVGDEGEDLSRHDKWLCMMYPRLMLLKNLLCNEGLIFISIDDGEGSRLRLILEDIFGQKSYVTTLVWEKKKKGTHLDKKRISIKEYVLVFCKNPRAFNGLVGEIKRGKETYPCLNPGNKRSVRTIPAGTKSNYSEDSVTLHKGEEISSGNMYLTLLDDLIIENKRLTKPVRIEAEWRYTQENISAFAKADTLYFTRDLYLRNEVFKARKKKLKDLLFRVEYGELIEKRDELIEELEKNEPDVEVIKLLKRQINNLENYHHLDTTDIEKLNNTGWGSNEDGDEEIRNIFGKKIFDYPKPSKLILKLLATTQFSEGYFLDSFAGTGTLAHSVLKLNEEDEGNRKFILVEMEDYANSITAERVKRVMRGYGKDKKKTEGTGGAFDFYDLGQPLFDENALLNEEVEEVHIREYVWYSETKTAFPKEKSKSDHKHLLGTKDETDYYFYYEKKCITTLNYDFLATITQQADQYVIYADNCLLSKKFMRDRNIIFKKIPRDITRF